MEKIGMVDEAFLLARMGKKKDGSGPTREEFNELVERVGDVESVAAAAGEAAQAAQETAESKQDALESGVNIKKLNGESLLGSGDAITGYVAVYGETDAADIIEYMESVPDNAAPIIVKRGSDCYTSILSVKQADNKVLLRCVGSYSGSYYLYTYTVTDSTWASNGQGLQNILVSGENIKTINNQSLLGSGNVDIPGGGSVFVAEYNVTPTSEIVKAVEGGAIVAVYDSYYGEAAPGYTLYFLPMNVSTDEDSVYFECIYNGLQISYTSVHNEWTREEYEISYVSPINIIAEVNREVYIGDYKDVDGVVRKLYRKVVPFTRLPNNGEAKVAHNISGSFTVTSLSGIMQNSAGDAFLPLPLVTTDTTKMVYLSCGRINVTIQTLSDRSSYSATVTVEYFYNDL